MKALTQQSILLSGIYQCCEIVNDIASKGSCSFEEYTTVLTPLFSNENAIEKLFPDLSKLNRGLQSVTNNMQQIQTPSALHVNHYALALCSVERNLNKQPQLIQQIVSKVSACHQKYPNLTENTEDIISTLAQIYTEQVSDNSNPIKIRGHKDFLSTPFNAAKIRAILLAGLRLAIAWHQAGGKRWYILLKRKLIANECSILINQHTHTTA